MDGLKGSSSGELLVIEDFQPVSSTRALITGGCSFRDLHTLGECSYEFLDSGVLSLSDLSVVAYGTYLRLGNRYKGRIYYSDGWECPHQFFKSASSFYYAYGAPQASIYRDGMLLVPSGDDFAECGKPLEYRGSLYFEVRVDGKPDDWQVWRMDLSNRAKEFVTVGANPAIYGGRLYFGRWDEERNYHVGTRPL